jgi:molybdopterin/thiamine biosynthesis adenylyltransferase
MKENMKNEKEEIILKELEKIKEEAINSSGKKYYSISLKQIKEIAGKFQTKSRETEISALQNNIIPERYQRNLGVISPSEQTKLLQSKVVIIGAGGLGGTVLELLTRMGIGKLIIADKDLIVDSNLNRQILSTETNLGQNKAEVAIRRVKEINSSVEITGHSVFINSDNVEKIIEGAEVVVDALAGFNGQLTTIFPEDKGLELIYGSNKNLPEHGSEATLGAPTVTPALIASLEAQEVVKILLKRGKLFRNRLLYLDIEEGTMEILNL